MRENWQKTHTHVKSLNSWGASSQQTKQCRGCLKIPRLWEAGPWQQSPPPLKRNSACDTHFATICSLKDCSNCRAQKNNPDKKTLVSACLVSSHNLGSGLLCLVGGLWRWLLMTLSCLAILLVCEQRVVRLGEENKHSLGPSRPLQY